MRTVNGESVTVKLLANGYWYFISQRQRRQVGLDKSYNNIPQICPLM